MKPPVGIEPTIIRLRSACSTNCAKEALRQWLFLSCLSVQLEVRSVITDLVALHGIRAAFARAS